MPYVTSIEEVTKEETTLAIARKMLDRKMDIPTIINITELLEEEVLKLARDGKR